MTSEQPFPQTWLVDAEACRVALTTSSNEIRDRFLSMIADGRISITTTEARLLADNHPTLRAELNEHGFERVAERGLAKISGALLKLMSNPSHLVPNKGSSSKMTILAAARKTKRGVITGDHGTHVYSLGRLAQKCSVHCITIEKITEIS